MKTLFLPALPCLLLLSSAAISYSQDRVFPKRDAVASGKIVEITPASIKINVRGKDQTYEIQDVRKVSFDGEPNGLDRARESTLQGQFDQALDEVKKIALDDIKNPLIKQDIEFYRFYNEGKLALAGSGDRKAASDGLLAVANANPKTHHLYAIGELLGELTLAAGQPAQAARYFNILLTAPATETKNLGEYRMGEVELALSKTEEARTRFARLASANSTSPEMARLKSLAEVDLAVCDNLSGKSQEALTKLDALVQKYDSTDQALFARINNARGACYSTLGKTNQALYSYLQTDLLFFTDAEAHAEALYHLSQLWPKVGEPARAAEAKARLRSLYASSLWANKN